MPTYDFICEKCGETFEVKVSIKDYNRYKKQNCPKCNTPDNVRRNFTPPVIKFGAGFFKDGYQSAKNVQQSNDGD
tara:strand:- start:479 stop:703 length:225 start_codon:yes stop_codon:yes gene_type:complete